MDIESQLSIGKEIASIIIGSFQRVERIRQFIHEQTFPGKLV